MESISYLNGLEETPLPAITAGTANEYIRVNSNESAYELAQPSDILPSQTGVSSGSLLSTDGSTTSWTNDLNLAKVKLAQGSEAAPSLVWNDPQDNTGFYGDDNNSIIYAANGSNQVKFTTGGIQLYGSAGSSIRGLSSNDTILSNGSFGFSGQAPVMQQITPSPQSSARIIVNTSNIEFGNSGSSVTPSTRVSIGTTQVTTNIPFNITHAGSATNPSLMFGDSTAGGRSGMYSSPTDNTLNFCTNDVERMLIDNTGIKLDTVRAASGSQVDDKGYVFQDSRGSGLQWEATSGGILRLCYANSTMIGMAPSTVSINATNINANGTLTCSGKINAATGSSLGIGISGQSTGVDFNATNSTTNIRANGTVRLSCSTNGVSVTGNFTQSASSGNVNTSSGQTTHTGLFRIDKGTLANALEIISGNIISTSNDTNITSTSGTCSMGIIKANNAGTSVLNSVRVVDDNTGLFQGSAGRLDICAAGTSGLNLTTNRIQNQITFECARSLAFSTAIYNISQVYNIVTSTAPFIITKTASTGTIDLEFTTPANYFGNQEFKILVLDTGAGTARYRAQAETIHITGGAAAVTIATNTYHTFTKDRFHFVYCNIDGSRFYLIQT